MFTLLMRLPQRSRKQLLKNNTITVFGKLCSNSICFSGGLNIPVSNGTSFVQGLTGYFTLENQNNIWFIKDYQD